MFTGTVKRKNNPDCGKYGQSLAEIILVQMQKKLLLFTDHEGVLCYEE